MRSAGNTPVRNSVRGPVRTKNPRSVTVTMALAFFTLSAIALLISGTLQVIWSVRAQEDIVLRGQQLIAQDAAKTVSAFVEEKLGAMETSVRVADVAAADPASRTLLVESLLGMQPSFRQLVLLDLEGRILAWTSRLSQQASRNFQGRVAREGFTLLHKGSPYYSPVYVDPVSSEPLMTLAVSVRDPFGDLRGLLVAEMNLKFMWDIVNSLNLGPTGQAYVVDHEGMLIAFNDMARVLNGENLRGLEPVSAFVSAQPPVQLPGAQLYRGITGTRVIGTYVPLVTPDWAVVTEISAAHAFHDVFVASALSAGLTLFLALASGLVGMSLARHLTVPITRLADTATRIAAGDITQEATVSGPKEIAALAAAFNSMTKQLRQTFENLELRVRKRTAQLEASNNELEAFSYSVSHDLRAPLRAIGGYSRIMVEQYGKTMPEEAARYLGHIAENTRHMGMLIDGLLDLSRSGRMPMRRETVPSAGLVAEVVERLGPERTGRNVQVSVGELPDCQGDPTLLRQVWENLISNALKFSRWRTEAIIHIGWERQDGEGVYFVRDNGVGFDMKYAGRLFGVFQRLHSPEQFEGTGVGLAIVQQIIRRHGGRIWAEAAVDAGAAFYFTL